MVRANAPIEPVHDQRASAPRPNLRKDYDHGYHGQLFPSRRLALGVRRQPRRTPSRSAATRPETFSINGGAVTVTGGTATVANTALIQVFGQGGNDTIALDETNGALPAAQLFGGAGNDTLTGGSGNDQLFGGPATTPSSARAATTCCSAATATTR